MVSWRSRSPADTLAWGEALAPLLAAGDAIALDGDLGAGKTVLVKGIGRGLGIAERAVRSPTFTLVDYHEEGRLPLVHVDAYRLSGPEALRDLGLDAIVRPDAVLVVEWAARVAAALPEDRLEVRIEHAGESERRFALDAGGERSRALLARIAARASAGADGGGGSQCSG